MHDFHVADLIYRAIIEEAEKNKLQKVSSASIDLGLIMEHGEFIQPENLIFNIKMLAQGSIAENLQVIINSIEGDNWILKEIEGE